MKFAIAGAGAIGAYIGAQMARAGCGRHTVCARPSLPRHAGARRARDQRRGRLRSAPARGRFAWTPWDRWTCLPGRQSSQPARTRAPIAAALRPRDHRRQHAERHSVVVLRRARSGWKRSIPAASIAAAIEARRVVGSIVYLSTEIVEPGVIRHTEGNRITLGEPDGARSRALPRNLRSADRRRPARAHHHAPPPGDLGEAAGQHRVQSRSAR